jgi:WS/DGAT/MGAT family acyltransferase
MKQLTGHDASFLYLETPNAPMSGGSLNIYDPSTAPGGRVTFKGILRHFESRLHLAKSFREKLAYVPFGLDHPWWVEDKDFDLEYHVRHIALPQPGDWRQLCIQAARILSRPLDMSRPLWEVYVIEGLDNVAAVPPGSFALLSLGHHASMDGVSGMEMITAIHDLAADTEPPPPVEPWRPDPEPSAQELLTLALQNTLRSPARLTRVAGRTLRGFGRVPGPLLRREVALPPLNVPRTRFNGTVSPHRVVEGRRLDFAAVRRIKASVPGATVNDVVLTIVAGALRHYLDAKGERPAQSLIVMAPVSVRTDAERGTAGNQVSAMFVSLSTDIGDPAERLAAVHEATTKSKALNNAIGAKTLTEMTTLVPGQLTGVAARMSSRLGMANRTNPPYNTVVTNIPGPRVPLYMAGAELVRMYSFGMIHDGMGLMHVVNSYLDDVVISFTSDREMMPDPAFYADCLTDSFDELSGAT